jgi:hypothetical protein
MVSTPIDPNRRSLDLGGRVVALRCVRLAVDAKSPFARADPVCESDVAENAVCDDG